MMPMVLVLDHTLSERLDPLSSLDTNAFFGHLVSMLTFNQLCWAEAGMQSVPENLGAKQNGFPPLRRSAGGGPAVGVSGPEDSRPRIGRACDVQLQGRCSCLGHNLGNSWPKGFQEKAAGSNQAACTWLKGFRSGSSHLGGGLPLGNCIKYQERSILP